MVERYEDRAISRVLGWPEWPFMIPGILSLLLWAIVAIAQLVSPQAFDQPSEIEGMH